MESVPNIEPLWFASEGVNLDSESELRSKDGKLALQRVYSHDHMLCFSAPTLLYCMPGGEKSWTILVGPLK